MSEGDVAKTIWVATISAVSALVVASGKPVVWAFSAKVLPSPEAEAPRPLLEKSARPLDQDTLVVPKRVTPPEASESVALPLKLRSLSAGILRFEYGLRGKGLSGDDVAIGCTAIGRQCGKDDLGGDDIGR